jgi:hypothetical protein
MADDANTKDAAIDQALVAQLVGEVVARLQQQDSTVCDARVISVETVQAHQTSQLTISPSAVITPAARDEARRRGIKIQRVERPAKSVNQSTTHNIIDTDDLKRAETVISQLQRRGGMPSSATVVLSDTPAVEVHRQIVSGKRATMVAAIADVPRFAAELDPQVWVLDMKRLNIPAAVNVVAKIAQQGAG